MKRFALVLIFLLATVIAAAAQTQTQTRERTTNGTADPENGSPAVRNRVVGPAKSSNHVTRDAPATQVPKADTNMQDAEKPAWGNTDVPQASRSRTQLLPPVQVPKTSTEPANSVQPKLIKATSLPLDNPLPAVKATVTPNATGIAGVYRVGINDVLDIRLANVKTRESTLFTVLKEGLVEYPLLSKPLLVAGLTPDEIARRLNAEIKVIRNPNVIVTVRDYASHSVVITGQVDNPGRKILRREAIPLFAILSEALVRPDAAAATLTHDGKDQNLSLSNPQDLATSVVSGDSIKIWSAPRRFVYIGGDAASPGEKEFRDGMTLTQALLSAGGVPRDARNKVRVARRNNSGFLVTEDYNLQSIVEGKAQDPLLQAGDRIEVHSGVW